MEKKYVNLAKNESVKKNCYGLPYNLSTQVAY